MRFLTLAAAVSALAVAGAAHASSPPASQPAQLLFANGMDSPLKVTVDNAAIGDLAAQTVHLIDLPAGEHAISFVTDDGSSVSRVFQFDTRDIAEGGDLRVWCVYAVPQSRGSAYGALVKLPTEVCESSLKPQG